LIGSIIRHPKYGRGRIVGQNASDLEVFFFDRGSTYRVGRLSVQPEQPAKVRKVNVPAPPPSPKCREMIEALKLGVVPGEFVKEFTYGRKNEIEAISSWLESGEAMAILGEYGSGKSHLLEFSHHLALEAGYAVMRAGLDCEDAAPHNPFRVYRQLVLGFRAPGDLDFRSLLWSQREALKDHVYFRHLADNPQVWEWLEGQGPGSPPMYDHTTAANLYCHLITGVAHAAKRAGLKGLVVILDEAESVASPWLYLYQRERGPLFLEGLIRCTGNSPGLVSEVVARMKVDPTGPYRGMKTGLLYSGFNQASYAYRLPTHLKVIMAVAPAYSVAKWLQKLGVPVLEIFPLADVALREAYDKLYSFYRDAFPEHRVWNFEREGVFEDILKRCKLQRSTRHFLKGVIESLELKRHGISTGGFASGAKS
jgi:energy-coupling factor transporter ATP-binding protein EcfA2